MKQPTLVLPKGRLYKSIKDLFNQKGIELPDENNRQYFFENYFEDCNLFLAKPKAIPQLIGTKMCEFAFCGEDIILNSEYVSDIQQLKRFNDMNKIKIVLASKCKNFDDLKNPIKVVATEFPKIASDYFSEIKHIPHYVLNTYGSTEGYINICCDCIIDVCETGDTLQANGLYINDVILESCTSLFTHISLGDCMLPYCLQKVIE